MFLPLGHLNKDAESKSSDIEDKLGKAVSSKQQFSPKQTSSSPVEDKFTSALTEVPKWMGTKPDTVLTPLNRKEVAKYVEDMQEKLKDGWTVHAGQDGRLFYCNHITQTAGWLPPCENWNHSDVLPYGWERAIDSKGRAYFINHINKTSTYEAPDSVRWDEHQPETRVVVLQRSPNIGFGFVAGSERPVIVRFVTEGGSSMNKLQPGDQILAVNNEDVKEAPRDHVIQLVRACESQVTLLVCQPANINGPGRKSTLLSAGKRAKLRSRPSRVRFAESVCVNGAPLFPPSAFSLGDICVPPMANVLKVFLENGQTKSFKYDATTTVQDVVSSLYDKLCIHAIEHFMLALEHVKSLKRNKLTFLDPEESLAKIASRPGAHKLRCLFRVAFVPISAAELARKDQNALDYLFMQCCNDVTQDRFSSELHPETSLRLAALHMHQHALANNVSPVKLTVKIVEKEYGLERFMSSSLLEGMKRKELRRLIGHFLKANSQVTGSSMKMLTQLQAKIHYLDIISGLPSYGAKCFSANQREGVERVLLVSPRFGLSQIAGVKNSVPQRISAIEDCVQVAVSREDDIICTVDIFILGDRVVKFSMEDRDASEFSLVLSGYYRLLTGKSLPIDKERETYDEDNAPSYLAQHTVLASTWSYVLPFHNNVHSINFLLAPPYHSVKQLSKSSSIKAKSEKSSPLQRPSNLTENGMSADGGNQFDRNLNPTAMSINSYNPSHSTLFNGGTGSNCLSHNLDLDIHSVMAMELLEEAKDSGLSDSSGGGSNSAMYCPALNGLIEARNEGVLRRVAEMQKMVENSEQYLNEQGEIVDEEYDEMEKEAYFSLQSQSKTASAYRPSLNIDTGTIEYFDSDCDSLNSSKVSSNEDAPSAGILKHSDSLVLLAEAINQDLSGITKGLNSIDGSIKEGTNSGTENLSASTPKSMWKVNGLNQLLSELQVLSHDCSQSESDSESIHTPSMSPIQKQPIIEQQNKKKSRSSFGLHSPDESSMGTDAKDYNLKEYLKQLKDYSKFDDNSHDTDFAAQKLSEIYGFEIGEDTFIETDPDLIDLRSIPPPQTPDELDALSILNAAPRGFGDSSSSNRSEDSDGDLDKFLEKVIIAPPTEAATSAKELTPEEIMSFIIPPPPNLESIANRRSKAECVSLDESLYSNSQRVSVKDYLNETNNSTLKHVNVSPVIEYATVERKGAFSCCAKGKKVESANNISPIPQAKGYTEFALPPRRCTHSESCSPPARPPKSVKLQNRFSPKKHKTIDAGVKRESSNAIDNMPLPPAIPPRYDERSLSPVVSVPPKKPPLPLHSARPVTRVAHPLLSPTQLFPTITDSIHFHADQNNIGSAFNTTQSDLHHGYINEHYRFNSKCNSVCFKNLDSKPHFLNLRSPVTLKEVCDSQRQNDKLISKNGYIIDVEALLSKTDIAMTGLLAKLDHVAAQCTAGHAAGGGSNINEDMFQRAREELTDQSLALVTASKLLVVAMSDMTLTTLPEHLTSCLTAIRKITEFTEDMSRHTSSPLQTRNIVLKVHDVASNFRELVLVKIGPLGAGTLALQAECLANVLATLLRSLRVFSP